MNGFTRVLATTGGATALSFLLAACGSTGTPTVTATPRVSASETATPAPEVMPAELQKYADMPSAEFMALPIEERIPYCTWVTRDMPDIAAKWFKKSNDKLDQLPVASTSNTPQQIAQIHGYDIRAAVVSHENANVILDPETEKKVLSCAFTDVNSPLAQKFFDILNAADAAGSTGLTPAYAASQKVFPMQTVNNYENPTTVNGVTTEVIDLNNPDGTVSPVDFRIFQAKNYQGKQVIRYAVTN